METQYTTIRLSKKTKEYLDTITPRNMSYSDRLNKLFQESTNNDTIMTYVTAVKDTANYLSLEDFNKKLEEL